MWDDPFPSDSEVRRLNIDELMVRQALLDDLENAFDDSVSTAGTYAVALTILAVLTAIFDWVEPEHRLSSIAYASVALVALVTVWAHSAFWRARIRRRLQVIATILSY